MIPSIYFGEVFDDEEFPDIDDEDDDEEAETDEDVIEILGFDPLYE